MKLREKEMSELFEMKDAALANKITYIEAQQVKERMESERILLEKESAIKLLREKNKVSKLVILSILKRDASSMKS